MSRYTWNYNEIKKIYTDLQNKLKNETDPKKIKYLEACIKEYKPLFYVNRKKAPTIEEIIYEDIDITYDTYLDKILSFYEGHIPEYIDLLTGAYEPIVNAYNAKLDENYHTALSNDSIIEIILDFIKKMTPNDFYLNVKSLLEKKNDFLNITFSKDYSYQDNVTYFDKNYKKKFVLVTRHNDLLDFIGLPHELSHYILNDCNHEDYYNSNSRFLIEIEGCLINLLFSEYYQRDLKNELIDSYDEDGNIMDDSLYFKHKILGDIMEFIQSFIIKNEYLMSLNDDYKIDEDIFYNRTIDYRIVDTRKDILNTFSYLGSNEEDELKYGLSYLVAFDLYDMCLRDPEHAFYILKNIKRDKNVNDLIPYLRNNNITFMNDDYTSLKKYIKNMTN